MGRAYSQAPDSKTDAARSLARALSSGALFKRDSTVADDLGTSHFPSWKAAVPVGIGMSWPWEHRERALSQFGVGDDWSCQWEDVVDKVLWGSSRGQEGRRDKLPRTPKTKSTNLNWKCSLHPGWVIFDKVGVCNTANNRFQNMVKNLERKQGDVLRIHIQELRDG